MHEEKLQLSGIQHFAFCKRQWALIHIEKQWAENVKTVEGQIMHKRAHNASLRERRGDTLLIRDLSISSEILGISGKCDVVEFHLNDEGVSIFGEEGKWLPFPVEYKRGDAKSGNEDKVQLCAQAMCLEEMLCCSIKEGALYYGETRHRINVELSGDLREDVKSMISEMHNMYERGYTPKVRQRKACNACSLKEICIPQLNKQTRVDDYVMRHVKED